MVGVSGPHLQSLRGSHFRFRGVLCQTLGGKLRLRTSLSLPTALNGHFLLRRFSWWMSLSLGQTKIVRGEGGRRTNG